MNKKLIITEEQYKNLKFFILESTFFDMAEKTIKKGDTITIDTNGKELNFNVISNFTGQIYMDNIDENSEYFGKRVFLTKLSFEDNKNLVMQVAKDDEQKNEEPRRGNTWPKMTLKNVEDINVIRNDELLDGTNYDPNKEKNDIRKTDFIKMLLSLNEGDAIVLKTNGKLEEVVLDFMHKSSGSILFELSESTEDALGNVNITGVEVSTNEDDIEVSENGLLTIKIITYETKGDNMEKNESKIQNIKEYHVIETEEDTEEEKSGEEGEEDNPEIEPENNLDIKKMQQYMQNDPEFKKAFLNYKGKLAPSVWASFANEFKKDSKSSNKGPKSSGLIKVKGILDSYESKKLERFGSNFKKRAKIRFIPLENISIPYKSKGGDVDFILEKGKIYEQENAVYYKGADDSELSKNEFNLKLANNSFEIILKEKSDTPNVYICDVVKLYKVKVKNEQDEEVIQTKKTPPQKDVYIRLINSDGYESDENQKKQ